MQTLQAGEEPTLEARVLNATTGLPAQSGTVTFRYCSRPGPKNDIHSSRRSA